MLKLTSNTDALLARLAAVPAAIEAAVTPAISAAARAYATAGDKQQTLRTRMTEERVRRVRPDREKAMERFAKPELHAKPSHVPRAGSRAGSPPSAIGPAELDKLKQAAVQGALKALGRT